VKSWYLSGIWLILQLKWRCGYPGSNLCGINEYPDQSCSWLYGFSSPVEYRDCIQTISVHMRFVVGKVPLRHIYFRILGALLPAYLCTNTPHCHVLRACHSPNQPDTIRASVWIWDFTFVSTLSWIPYISLHRKNEVILFNSIIYFLNADLNSQLPISIIIIIIIIIKTRLWYSAEYLWKTTKTAFRLLMFVRKLTPCAGFSSLLLLTPWEF
jgi:hypothetical protein